MKEENIMKKFIFPEIELRELSLSRTVMDDITSSAEFPKGDNEQIVPDPAGKDEAVW